MGIVPGGSNANGLGTESASDIDCGTGLLTPIVAVVRGFTHFTDHGRFSDMNEIMALHQIMTLTNEIHCKISKYVSHPSSSMP